MLAVHFLQDFNYELEAPGQQHAEDAIAPSGLSLFSIANASSFSIARFNPFGRAQKPSATPKHKPIVEEEEEDSDAGKLEHELDSYVKEELAQAKKSKSVDGAVAKEDASKQKTVRTMVME